MSNGVYFSASARLQKGIAANYRRIIGIFAVGDGKLSVLLPEDILTPGIRIPAREHEVFPCSQRTVFIIVDRSPSPSLPP